VKVPKTSESYWMSKSWLISLGVLLILGIIGLIALLIRDNGADVEREIAKASAEFKADQNFRVEPAKKLVPYLKNGMTTEEVETLLGEPDSKAEGEYYARISYIVGRSNMITVFLDENEKVIHVESVWSEYASPFERVWPLLRPGMTKQYILRRLGGPQKELKDGKEYQYQYRDDPVVFTISFDMNDKVVKLERNWNRNLL
jgi:hypothetical protein